MDKAVPDVFLDLQMKTNFKYVNDFSENGDSSQSQIVLPCVKKLPEIPRNIKTLKRFSSRVSVVSDDFKDKNNASEIFTEIPDNIPTENGKHQKPLRYCVFIAKFPFVSYILASSFHLIVLIVTASLVLKNYNVFPVDFEQLPLILYTDSARTRDLAWRDRDKYNLRIRRPGDGAVYPSWYNSQIGDTVEVILETKDNNIFSKDYLLLLSHIEYRLMNLKDFQDTFCWINGAMQCEKPWSILRLFDGTYNSTSTTFYNPSFSDINNVLCKATIYNTTRKTVEYYIEKGLKLCNANLKTDKTRLFYFVGWPLRGGNSGNRLKQFIMNAIKPELENLRDGILDNKMNLYYISKNMFENDVVQQAMSDMMLAIGSFSFIFLFMWIQTASFWITFMGIFSIITSFLLTNLFYRFVLQYEYFGFFHIIAMFIILGIGADDVFIFYDTWRLTGHTKYQSKAHRLSDCYRKAAKTTFVTSLTTAAAFLVSAFSPFLPVSSFGAFSGILVLVNYLCDLLYFPTVIMVYSTKIKPTWDAIFRKCMSKIKTVRVQDGNSSKICTNCGITPFKSCLPGSGDVKHSSSEPNLIEDVRLQKATEDTASVKSEQIQKSEKARKHFEDRNKIVLFLKNGFFDVMTLRVVRIVVPLSILIVSTGFAYSASNLEPDSKQVQIYRESHNYGKASRMHTYSFERNFEEEYTSVYLVWGLKEKDMTPCNLKSSKYCRGKSGWDDRFDASSQEAQQAFVNLCQRLEGMSSSEADSLRIRRNTDTNKLEISCFTTPLNQYMTTRSLSMPFDSANVTNFMQSNSHIYNVTALPSSFDRYLEIMLSYWLTNSYTVHPTSDFFQFNHLVGEQAILGTTHRAMNSYRYSTFYGTKLKYIAVQINTTMSVYTLGYIEGKPIYQRWETFMNEQISKMPASMRNGFQCTRDTWHWIKVQEILSESAVNGVIIGISVALPLLIFTTMNVVIGALATLVIGLVTTCVIGIIPLAGWKLGVLESLNLCMVVGLSVDYVVHLAEAYSKSESTDRLGRVRSMLESMGLSVLSGAITTFGASIFLLFTQIQFLYQFGIFVMSTISISLLFSIFGFTSFMALCGPQGNTGDLNCVWRRLKKLFKKRKDPEILEERECKS